MTLKPMPSKGLCNLCNLCNLILIKHNNSAWRGVYTIPRIVLQLYSNTPLYENAYTSYIGYMKMTLKPLLGLGFRGM